MELLEIEKELGGPNGVEAMERYDRVLVALEARRAQALKVGVAPAEFPRVEALGEAITLARKLLRLQIKQS